MSATGRQINWTVSWTPTSGSADDWEGVQGVDIDHQGELQTHSGDADRYPTTKAGTFEDPTITVSLRQLAAIDSVANGDDGVLVCTNNDARNAATTSGGAYTVTMDLAVIGTRQWGGRHRQFSEGSIRVEGESTDGATDPITYAAV